MREIKFRAWDSKKMHLPEYSDKEDFHLLADGRIVFTREYGIERHELTENRGDNWVVMQFTGLLDKNGKEIYEGDIMKQVYYPLGADKEVIEYYKEFVVVWFYGGFGVRYTIDGANILDETKKMYYQKTERKRHRHPTQGEDWHTRIWSYDQHEVIGNIYENPELIK